MEESPDFNANEQFIQEHNVGNTDNNNTEANDTNVDNIKSSSPANRQQLHILYVLRYASIVSIILVVIYLLCGVYYRNCIDGKNSRSDLKYFVERVKRTASSYPAGHIKYTAVMGTVADHSVVNTMNIVD